MESDLRRWMRLCESPVVEGKFGEFEHSDGHGQVVVYEVKSRAELDGLLRRYRYVLRGIVDGPELYMWDAMVSTHHTVSETLGLGGYRIGLRKGKKENGQEVYVIEVNDQQGNRETELNLPAILRLIPRRSLVSLGDIVNGPLRDTISPVGRTGWWS